MKKRAARRPFAVIVLVLFCVSPSLEASEVFKEMDTRVVVREHPRTGRPYVSIVSDKEPERGNPFPGAKMLLNRPDYRLLDHPAVQKGEIAYDGPFNSRKKVYVFAATLATVGVTGGALGMAVAPISGAVASGGGAYLAGGAALASGAAAAAVRTTSATPGDEAFSHTAESKRIFLAEADQNDGKEAESGGDEMQETGPAGVGYRCPYLKARL